MYVDDMKLSGPKEHMDACWAALGSGIKLEKPKGDTKEDEHTFLGCIHRRVDRYVSDSGKPFQQGEHARVLRCMEYDMTAAMRRTAD